MSDSFLTSQWPALATFTGREEFPLDANPAGLSAAGAGPQPYQEKLALYKLAMLMTTMMNTLDKTMVDGTIYYTQFSVGALYTPTPRGSTISEFSFEVNGVNIAVGTPGGTDTWHVGLWNSSGVLVARSATAGVLAGTALTIQQIPFYGSTGAGADPTPVTISSGTYYLGLQSNGTTAKFKAINSPIWGTTLNPIITGSQAGAAGTLPAISPISTTYTADLGPMASLY